MKNTNEFKTFLLKSNNSAYDIIGDIHSSERKFLLKLKFMNSVFFPEQSTSSSTSNHVRDSGYETTSSNIIEQRRQSFLSPPSPSNVSLSPDGQLITVTYFSSPIPSSNNLPRTLKTFSQMPVGNESSTMTNARLAEQEIIEI